MYKGHWIHSLLYFEFIELTLIYIKIVARLATCHNQAMIKNSFYVFFLLFHDFPFNVFKQFLVLA